MTRRSNVRMRSRGVALIEALVALAVTAVGMMALVGLQGVLRSNSDIAKQRSEAVRIGQAALEDWRSFDTLATYAAIGVTTNTTTVAGVNATYTVSRTPTDLLAPQVGKTVRVTVAWRDRSDEAQQLQLTSVIAGVAPELAATMAVPPDLGSLVRRPYGRDRSIPPQAVNLGDGRSAYQPPGASASTAWVFNNISGIINLCSLSNPALAVPLVASNLSCSSTAFAKLLSGALRYSTALVQPTTADAFNPASLQPSALAGLVVYVNQTVPFSNTVQCYTDNTHALTLPSYTLYFCAVPIDSPTTLNPSPVWSGTLAAELPTPVPAPVPPAPAISVALADDSSSNYKLCRYFPNATYANVLTSLANQNVLITAAGNGTGSGTTTPFTCPAPTAPLQPTT